MSGEREAKRARQACLNCRRKKTRCHGERPACALCVRLGQRCEYPAPVLDPGAGSGTMPFSTAQQHSPPYAHINEDLASRVERLEAQLRAAEGGAVIGPGSDPPGSSNLAGGMWPSPGQAFAPQSIEKEVEDTSPQWSRTRLDAEGNKFAQVPPVPVLKSLVETYLANCHNQPYCFFHESNLRRRVAANDLPRYLILAFVATAARYSTHEYFEDRQLEAVESFSRAAWVIILHQVFATEGSPDISAAQACSMLAIIDFTAGHHRLGWFKIGLAIRLVQGIKLNTEPDSTLPAWQQEEHRRIFWSLYVLDKFVSCGKSRPPSILDVDCTLALPCSEVAFRMEMSDKMMPLSAYQGVSNNVALVKGLDHFAVLVLMSATLDLTVRDMFQPSSTSLPPWDCRSNFAKIGSILLSFESMHAVGADSLALYLADRFGTHEGFDRQRVGHFIWARGVYHLCGCLLYHPISLYRQRQAYGQDFPPTFAREILDRVQVHAAQLTTILQTLQTTGCCARGSLLGYFAACAASVHQLYVHSPDRDITTKAAVSLATCFGFLEHLPVFWPSYSSTAAALGECHVDAGLARLLVDPSAIVLDSAADSAQIDSLWRVIDYGWLSDSGRRNGSLVPPFPSEFGAEIGDWMFFDDPVGENRALE